MRISIWDLDYFFAKKRVNCFNPDIMKISSYHKQSGDIVNFILTEDDISRPYDIIYIVKEKDKTPHPPRHFFFEKNVRWWGKSYRLRINWRMSDVMLACRPDYLLYPERETKLERAEFLRLFNNDGKPLGLLQDWTNNFKNKPVIVTDPYMWCASKKDIIEALKKLQTMKKVSFLEPIWIQKLASDQDIKNEFLKLNLASGIKLHWTTIKKDEFNQIIEFLKEFKETYFHKISIGGATFDYRDKNKPSHWESKEQAFKDFELIREIAQTAKEFKINIKIKMPETRLETPYFLLFEELANWSQYDFQNTWLEYITYKWGKVAPSDYQKYWTNPKRWNEVFRELLLQTWNYSGFIRHKWGQQYISENDIPWTIWENEFKLNF